MTDARADRRERAAELCRRLAADVAKVAPKGLGAWPPAWEIVEAPSKRFLDLLDEYVETGERERLIPPIREAYAAVVAAWEEAARRWTRAGSERKGVAHAA